MHDRPKVRTDQILTEWVGDDLVVLDRANQTGHSLSPDAAAVWELCDGSLPQADIAQRTGLAQGTVARAVDALRECGLLDEGPHLDGDGVVAGRGYSRREATIKLAKAGGAAFLTPMIYSAMVGEAAGQVNCGFPPCGCRRQCTSAQVPTGPLPVNNTVSACGGFTLTGANPNCSGNTAWLGSCGRRSNSSCCYGVCYPWNASCGIPLGSVPTGTATLMGTCTGPFRCATQYGCQQHAAPCPTPTDLNCGTFGTSGNTNWCRGSTLQPAGNAGVQCCPPGVCCASPSNSVLTSGFNYGCCSGWCNTGGACGCHDVPCATLTSVSWGNPSIMTLPCVTV